MDVMLTFETELTTDQVRMSQYHIHHNGYSVFLVGGMFQTGGSTANLAFISCSHSYGWRFNPYPLNSNLLKTYILNTSCVTKLWL